jgi:hypothetical protein
LLYSSHFTEQEKKRRKKKKEGKTNQNDDDNSSSSRNEKMISKLPTNGRSSFDTNDDDETVTASIDYC